MCLQSKRRIQAREFKQNKKKSLNNHRLIGAKWIVCQHLILPNPHIVVSPQLTSCLHDFLGRLYYTRNCCNPCFRASIFPLTHRDHSATEIAPTSVGANITTVESKIGAQINCFHFLFVSIYVMSPGRFDVGESRLSQVINAMRQQQQTPNKHSAAQKKRREERISPWQWHTEWSLKKSKKRKKKTWKSCQTGLSI